ncbi:hypothetical protein HELRODRAFT_135497, partial [Helobdella robusta]|uniref:TPX2 C-terminal domain-containing protein n=1 Tax=Helobdella robusta TaxID=6412 RepID=T1EI91_HELRO
PFSFDSRDKEMLEKKEQKIKAVYEMEKEARKFVANPLPEFVPNLPAKKLKPATMIEEFILETDKRAAIQHEKWQKLLEEEMLRDKESRTFKAKPASVLNNEPFVPELQHNSSTLCLHGLTNEERHVPTNLEKRATEWQQRNKLILKHQEEIERHALENQKIRMEEEEKEVKKMRDQMVHQAQPIKSGKPLKIEPSNKPVTEPKSPNFSKRL